MISVQGQILLLDKFVSGRRSSASELFKWLQVVITCHQFLIRALAETGGSAVLSKNQWLRVRNQSFQSTTLPSPLHMKYVPGHTLTLHLCRSGVNLMES